MLTCDSYINLALMSSSASPVQQQCWLCATAADWLLCGLLSPKEPIAGRVQSPAAVRGESSSPAAVAAAAVAAAVVPPITRWLSVNAI